VTLHCGAEEADSIARRLSEICTLITVDGVDWNRELSPWKAEKVFRGEEDFAREADQYLKELTGQILPAAETAAGIHPFKRVIAGYSMAGLFAVYALFCSNVFCGAATVSGSLWYDGFCNFAERNQPVRIPEAMYFSVGDREHLARNSRMAAVEERTKRMAELFCALGVPTIFERRPGGHFVDVEGRTEKGIRSVCGMLCPDKKEGICL
jgi:Predicted hydrolase of the alpha/beta superfamily